MNAVALAVNWPLSGFLESALGFIIVMTFMVMAIGLASRSLSVGAAGGYIAFVYFASNVDSSVVPIISEVMYVSIVVITLGIGFKFWRLELSGEGGV